MIHDFFALSLGMELNIPVEQLIYYDKWVWFIKN